VKVIFLISALQRFLFCSTFNNISAYSKRKKSKLGQLEDYFEKIDSIFKDTKDLYYIKHCFKGDTRNCKFKMKKTSVAFPLHKRLWCIIMKHVVCSFASVGWSHDTLRPNTGKHSPATMTLGSFSMYLYC
jgi:hypothetical protein